MFTALLQTQKAAVSVVVFIATFFVVLAIGRWMKRRAGVRFGVLFQLFCLTLALYTAALVDGLNINWRHHFGAALILLSATVVVALIDRYLWDFYFEKKRLTVIPRFPRQIGALIIFFIALLLVLSVGYHAGAGLSVLLSGSGILAIVLGFATQNLLGGIIAGMSLQMSKPYRVGDWLQVGERFAEVMEINWRSTRLRTNDAIYLDIPNNEIVRQTIINLHYPQQLHAMRISVGVEYGAAPNRVKDTLMRATLQAEGVIHDPKPKVFLKEFGDFAIVYEIKFWMGNHAAYNDVTDAIRTNIWYEFKRQKLTIPFPIRTLERQRKPAAPPHDEHDKARSILQNDPLFRCLSEEQIESLIEQANVVHFGRGERVIEEGADGQSMFILVHGSAQVSVSQNGSLIRVGALREGDCFGEMSLLTGEKRTATVRAEHDCAVLEISKPVMADLLRDSPDCLTSLSELLAQRKLETEGIVRGAADSEEQASKEREYKASFLKRLHAFFEL
jgi:small-conductance mechanosensitive channel